MMNKYYAKSTFTGQVYELTDKGLYDSMVENMMGWEESTEEEYKEWKRVNGF